MTTLSISSGRGFELDDVPLLEQGEAQAAMLAARDVGARLCAMFAAESPAPEMVRLWLVAANDVQGQLEVCCSDVSRTRCSYEALTPHWMQAHMFEREIAEQYGLHPKGHPWLKPLRGELPIEGPDLFVPPVGSKSRLDAYPFLRASGEEMHEVGVGPVHAGIIEPGHFRFLCHGERAKHLEISLGYQARGSERSLLGGPDKRTTTLIESIAGDTAVANMLSYSRVIDGLSGTRVSARAMAIRAIALELERCANHVGDLGALANDVGYLPAAAWFSRLRGEFLNSLMDLSGNRYGRGLVRPGGVAFDLDEAMVKLMVERLQTALAEFERFAELLFAKPSVMARFDDTGVISREIAEQLGLVGPAARACGCQHDVRHDFAHGSYRFLHIPVAVAESGDVAARALVRRLETERSIEFVIELLGNLPDGETKVTVKPLPPERGIVVLTEGWRGEIVHLALTDEQGRFTRYKVVDPSFRNWTGLAHALRDQEISDFPLCNKSFNLSYAGHDL